MAASADDVFTISAVAAVIALETIGEAETVPVACLSATPERLRGSRSCSPERRVPKRKRMQ